MSARITFSKIDKFPNGASIIVEGKNKEGNPVSWKGFITEKVTANLKDPVLTMLADNLNLNVEDVVSAYKYYLDAIPM